MPRRHQLRRDKPLPRGVVRVDRATMWGNPFRADRVNTVALAAGAASAAGAFRLWLNGLAGLHDVEPERRAAILARLGLLHGKDLACWCGPDAECHADVLLDLARAATPTTGDALGRPEGVPHIALSVRQPWAWALIYGGKDVENRSEMAVRNGGMRDQVGKRIAIHASKGMTRAEYEDGRDFMASIGVTCPPAADLQRGGIIGTAFMASVVKDHISKWFFGPRGLCLTHPEPIPFIGATGELGMFSWSPNFAPPDAPAKWMRPSTTTVNPVSPRTVDLFS